MAFVGSTASVRRSTRSASASRSSVRSARAAPRRPKLVFGPVAAARRKQPIASSRWPSVYTRAPARNYASVSDGSNSVARS